jgi:TolA-binding protein
MTFTMGRFALTFCGLLVLAAASGCADITVRNSEPQPSADYQAAPPDDGRAAGSIRNENASLRARMQELEQRHSSLASAVEAQDKQKDSLKRQRDQVEKERDREKKLLKKSE